MKPFGYANIFFIRCYILFSRHCEEQRQPSGASSLMPLKNKLYINNLCTCKSKPRCVVDNDNIRPLIRRGKGCCFSCVDLFFKGTQEGYAVWLDPKVTKRSSRMVREPHHDNLGCHPEPVEGSGRPLPAFSLMFYLIFARSFSVDGG